MPRKSTYWDLLQLNVNSRVVPERGRRAARTLVELIPGEQGVLERLELPDDVAQRLMELGFLPGSPVTAAGCAPGGDPRVFRVDGSEIALRRETAVHLKLQSSAIEAL